jgi:hypothetical protein
VDCRGASRLAMTGWVVVAIMKRPPTEMRQTAKLSSLRGPQARGNPPAFMCVMPFPSAPPFASECGDSLVSVPLAPLGGEGGPKGRERELFRAERSDGNFSQPSSGNNVQGNICGALRRRVCSLSRPCRGTLPRRAGEREASGGAGGKDITQMKGGWKPPPLWGAGCSPYNEKSPPGRGLGGFPCPFQGGGIPSGFRAKASGLDDMAGLLPQTMMSL